MIQSWAHPGKAKRVLVFLVALIFAVALPETAHAKGSARTHMPLVAHVDLVQVHLIVFDDKGAVAAGLKKSDFRVLDDGVVQQVLNFERVRTPVSFVILADLSSSMTRKIPFVQEAALSLLDPLGQQDQPGDEYEVLGIGRRASRLVPFTRDVQDLEQRLPLILAATNESTALFDGIYLGVTTVQQGASNQRRAMIIISDGGDNHSRYNIHETRQLLEESDVPVFAVMAGPTFALPDIFPNKEKNRKEPGPWPQLPTFPGRPQSTDYIGPAERHGPHNLSVLTEATGGGVFTAAHEEDLPRIVQTIGLAMRYEYLITYMPLRLKSAEARRVKNGGEDSPHKIHIELYPKEKFKEYSIPYYKGRYISPE